MEEKAKCPACTSEAIRQPFDDFYFYVCPVCGRFELGLELSNSKINRNHLASYLVYHCFPKNTVDERVEYRYHTFRDKNFCDNSVHEFAAGNRVNGLPVYMDMDIIENWYPKTFAERVDNILLYLASHTEHIGQSLILPVNRLLNVLFVDKQRMVNGIFSSTEKRWVERYTKQYIEEANYMLRFLKQQHYIETDEFVELKPHSIVLAPEGYARVDELQKNTSSGRNVLVAMSFHNTKNLREAIRKGVSEAGYSAVFIDEVEHNNLITPELLKHIKDSKFVVVDLTHQNNGAYFEAGYAMGLGKPVIQLCKHGTQLHFDIAQKNTIMWEMEDDIPERLTKRIKATID